MDKALIDTSTYLDILKADKNRKASWAQKTLIHTLAYMGMFKQMSISAFTIYEVLDGINRGAFAGSVDEFLDQALPEFDVFYPNQETMALGAQINAQLVKKGMTIGVVDSLIAATAIQHGLLLVNANTKHFKRVRDVGFALEIKNWREP